MKKASRIVLLSYIAFLPYLSIAHADEVKIGYVNSERVIREAPLAISTSKKMELEFGFRRKQLSQLRDEISERQDFLVEKGRMFNEGERRVKELELNDLLVNFKRKQDAFQEDLNSRQNEEGSAIIEKANKAIINIAESEHFDLILQEVVFVGKPIDITDKVIKKLSGD